MLDSLAETYLETNVLDFWTKSTDIPASYPIQLTTTDLDIFFTGMEAFYGPDLPVDIQYNVMKIDKFSSKENDSTLSFYADAEVAFWVNEANGTKSKAVDMVMSDFFFNFTALVDGMTVVANITNVHIQAINITSTTFGKVDLNLVTKLLNGLLSITVPIANIYIATQKIIIPDELFGLFTLSDITVKYHDNYLEAGLTPTFVPPTLNEIEPLSFEEPEGELRFELGRDENGQVEVIEFWG